MDREIILKNANIPEEKWSECYISDDGRVFTPIKDSDENIIISAEEWYKKVTNPPITVSELSLEERIAMLENLLLQQEGVI